MFTREFAAGLIAGAAIASACLVYLLGRPKRAGEDRWSNKVIKQSVLEMIGFTPMVRLASLSRCLECEVYLKMEN